MRALRLILLVPLVFVAFLAPETHADAVYGSNGGDNFHLKGILMSRTSSSALVNNTVLREGEQVDGIEILEIREGEVRVRRGSQQLTVWVGTRAHWDLATPYEPAAQPTRMVRSGSADSYVRVQRGDTLSEIAERHLVGNVTRHQMMVALYDANPDAFDGNINWLREGAVLKIPDADSLYRHDPATAVAQVLRQADTWRADDAPQSRRIKVATPQTYGPVARGQTLSHIAAKLARNGTTMNQMMIALFEANPQAFDGNINLLQQGAVLQVPGEAALLRHSHETATAAVLDHMNAWRHGSVLVTANPAPSWPESG